MILFFMSLRGQMVLDFTNLENYIGCFYFRTSLIDGKYSFYIKIKL